MLLKNISPTDKLTLDIVSVGTAVGTIMNILPAIAAILTIIWTGIRIYETKTVQKLLGNEVEKSNNED